MREFFKDFLRSVEERMRAEREKRECEDSPPTNNSSMDFARILDVLARGFTIFPEERRDVRQFWAQSCGYCRRAVVKGLCVRHDVPTAVEVIWKQQGLQSLLTPLVLSQL